MTGLSRFIFGIVMLFLIAGGYVARVSQSASDVQSIVSTEEESGSGFAVVKSIDTAFVALSGLDHSLSNQLLDNGRPSDQEIADTHQALVTETERLRRLAALPDVRNDDILPSLITDFARAVDRLEPLVKDPGNLERIEAASVHVQGMTTLTNNLRIHGAEFGLRHFQNHYTRLRGQFLFFAWIAVFLILAVGILIAVMARQVHLLRLSNAHSKSLADHLTIAKAELEQASIDIAAKNDQLRTHVQRLQENEKVLEAKNQLFLAAVENIAEGLTMYSGEGRLEIANSNFIRMYGLNPAQIRPGLTLLEVQHQTVRAGTITHAHALELRSRRNLMLEPAATSTHELVRLDGRIIEIFQQRLADGGVISTHEDITERRLAHSRMQYLANHDALTGLANRTQFNERLEVLLEKCAQGQAGQNQIGIILFDLDRFKAVNDLHGHAAGDHLLILVGQRLRQVAGSGDLIARLGGDEFAILLFEERVLERATELSARLVATIQEPFDLGMILSEIGISAGIAVSPLHGSDARTLLRHADLALYHVKSLRLNGYRVFEPAMMATREDRRMLEAELAAAIGTEGLSLAFQPIVETETGMIVGAEALLRWISPTRGPVRPDLTISIAEESGLVIPLGNWILTKAIETCSTWPEHLTLAINLSSRQFKNEGLTRTITGALERYNVAATRIELEVTETVLCDDDAGTVMDELRNIGIRFSLDDFGTGYASMSYLTRFPFDRIKIDQSFVRDASDRRECRAIIDAVCNLANTLGMETIAEGIETESELATVIAAGCGFGQGYYFGRPMPARDFLALAAAQSVGASSTHTRTAISAA